LIFWVASKPVSTACVSFRRRSIALK
jgi:hypothetical protein